MNLFKQCSNLHEIPFAPINYTIYNYPDTYIDYMEQDFDKLVQKILNRCNGQHIINYRNFRYPIVRILSPREFVEYHGVDAIPNYLTDVNILTSNIRKVQLSKANNSLFIYIPSKNIYIDYSHFLVYDVYADKCHRVNKELQSSGIDIRVYPSLFGDIEFDTDSNDLIFRKTKTRCIVKDRATTADKITEEAKQLQIHVIRRKQNATTSRD